MLQYIKIAVLVLIPCFASAQSVSVDPYSFKAWGEMEASTMISVEYKIVGLHYIKVHKTQYSPITEEPTPASMLGVSIMSPYIKDVLRGGIIYFTSEFPTPTDTRLNAFIEASYQFKQFRIHYRHISNAGIGDTNHGIDYMGISVHL